MNLSPGTYLVKYHDQSQNVLSEQLTTDGRSCVQPGGSRCEDVISITKITPGGGGVDGKIVFQRGFDENGQIILLDSATGTETPLGPGKNPAFSPNGALIAFERNNQVIIMNADGTNQRVVASGQHPTWSPDGSFIAYVGQLDPETFLGNIFSVDAQGVHPPGHYCGYIGGAGDDGGLAITVDDAGSAYVAGSTASPPESFPVNQGPSLTYNGGLLFGDGFVAKVKADGTGLDFAGYVGGSADDIATGIALDRAGNLYVSGATPSAAPSFPAVAGPRLTSGGLQDAFVAKIILGNGGGGTGPEIIGVSRQKKNLLVEGRNFDAGAVILLNGERQKTIHDDQNPTTMLTGKKVGKKAHAGDKIKVRNSDGAESPEWTYTP